MVLLCLVYVILSLALQSFFFFDTRAMVSRTREHTDVSSKDDSFRLLYLFGSFRLLFRFLSSIRNRLDCIRIFGVQCEQNV